MQKIYFTKDISNLKLNLSGKILVLYNTQYSKCLPKIANATYLEFKNKQDFTISQTLFQECTSIVFVGINKIINPVNRIWQVFEILFNNSREKNKISIDNAPYMGDLWRFWFHFGLTDSEYSGYTYSYILETNCNKFEKKLSDIYPMSDEEIIKNSRGVVNIDYEKFFKEPTIETIELSEDIHDEYQILKEKLFDTYDQITPIKNALVKFAREHCRTRKIPQLYKIFEKPNDIVIFKTDLKIDQYLTDCITEKISEVNNVSKILKGIQND